MPSLLLEFTVYGLLAYGTVHYFGLEVDWEQHAVHSRTSECQLGGQRTEAGPPLLTPLSFCSLYLPPVFPVAEDGDPAYHVAGGGLPHLGTADCPLEVCGPRGRGRAVQGRPDGTWVPRPPRWTQVRGWLRKFCTAVQLFIFGTATVALFVISLVGSTWGGGWGLEGQH